MVGDECGGPGSIEDQIAKSQQRNATSYRAAVEADCAKAKAAAKPKPESGSANVRPGIDGSPLGCLTPSSRKSGGFWRISNGCRYHILFAYRYKDTQGRVRTTSDGDVQPNNYQPIDSRADTQPTPVWACVAGSAGCNGAAVKAAAGSQ